jgi:cytochrome P450
MTFAKLTPQTAIEPLAVPAVGPASYLPGTGWIVTRSCQARAVLADPAYQVPEARTTGPIGSIAWLRSSVSRFTNGPDHAHRRGRVGAELNRVAPNELRDDAELRAHALIDTASGPGRIDVMETLARRVPAAVLAARLGIADPDRAAAAVRVTAAAYFPGAAPARERAADASTAELVQMLGPADEGTIVARIALLVQACDATAALIGTAVCHALPPGGDQNVAWPTDAIVAEVVRHDPPLRVTRRICRGHAELDGRPVAPGSTVLLRVDSANRDPELLAAPGDFDPGRSEFSNLTFGSGLRPCPGEAHALMLAAGVVQAVRDRCAAVIAPVEYEAPVDVRIPAAVVVSLK